jgi:hypothetical protein
MGPEELMAQFDAPRPALSPAGREPWYQQLSADEREFVDALLPKLPPVVIRKAVPEVLGQVVAVQTLSNADSIGQGPEVAWRVGRHVVYRTDSLLHWIIRRFGVSRIINLNNL